MSEQDLSSQQLYDNDDVLDPTEAGNRFFDKTTFNHQHLVMMAYMKSIETGAKEMKKGYWETKSDKFGNLITIYNPDTRNEFINSVRMLNIVTSPDLDSKYRNAINAETSKLAANKKSLAEQEHSYWSVLPINERLRIPHVKGNLNQELVFYQHYVNEEVESSYRIMRLIEMGLAENDYFKIAPAEITNDFSMQEVADNAVQLSN